MNPVKRYLLNVLVLMDQAVNCLVFFGSPDETISSRAAKAQLAGKKWGCVLCSWLNRLQKDHCAIALSEKIGDDAIIPDDTVPPAAGG